MSQSFAAAKVRIGICVSKTSKSRQMLSITVNTLTDENDTYVVDGTSNSLREAIAYAATQTEPQIIDFDSSLSDGAISLTHGELTVAGSLIIAGLGENHLTIDAEIAAFSRPRVHTPK